MFGGGFLLDSWPLFKEQVTAMGRRAVVQLGVVYSFLNQMVAHIVSHALVNSQGDYCSVLLKNIWKLQVVQNVVL